jgi:HEAT repeat protein
MGLLKNRETDAGPVASVATLRLPALLLATLRDGPTAAERREAALELATVPGAARDLAAALHEEVESSVREAIVTTLIVIGTREAAAGLADFINSDDPQLRNLAIEALRAIGPAAGSQVERLLTSPYPDVRIFAVNVLDAFFYRRAQDRERLHTILQHDPDVNVGLAAVEALSQVGAPEDLPALRAFAARFSEHPFVGFAVDLVCRRAAPGDKP